MNKRTYSLAIEFVGKEPDIVKLIMEIHDKVINKPFVYKVNIDLLLS